LGKYRSRLEIVANILSVVSEGAKKTHIMYGANLSYKLLNRYLGEVFNAGLVCLNGECYEITDKGQHFLEQCISLLEHKRRLNEYKDTVDDVKERLEELCSV